ncbi:unnamed protein product [Gongylonema pulchrum]|uniref:Secreted protein n=1 Tax=Gongylonema pulchrum TaxID=637853 RepID=A0A183D6L3_9BILA|nr:unnamed protein product [Gongylonema pulchrum]
MILVIFYCTLFVSFAALAAQTTTTAKPEKTPAAEATTATSSKENDVLKFIRIHFGELPDGNDDGSNYSQESIILSVDIPAIYDISGSNSKDDKNNYAELVISIEFDWPFDFIENNNNTDHSNGGDKKPSGTSPNVPVTESSTKSSSIPPSSTTTAKPLFLFRGLPVYNYSSQRNAPTHLTQL